MIGVDVGGESKCYHCRIAIGHYARLLGQESAKTPYPAIAVLSLLWLHATDPYAETTVVRVSAEDLEGLIASGTRLRQILAALRKVGAIRRPDNGGYALCKPTLDELDKVAREQLAMSPPMLSSAAAERMRLTPAEREANAVTRLQRKQERRRTAASRAQALKRLDKRPSDVRDMLARLVGVPATSMKYYGQGAVPVTLAIDWLASTGATWRDFYKLFATVDRDRSEDRPQDLRWLFAAKHAAYLQRMIIASQTLQLSPETEALFT